MKHLVKTSFRRKEMNKNQIPGSDPLFNFTSFEKEYGPIVKAEILCPGVCHVATGICERHPICGSEYIVVVGDTPVVSHKGRSYGTSLPDAPDILIYNTEEYFSKARWVIQYEIHKYLVTRNISLPEGESLDEDKVRGMEVCPEYFGEFPLPTETPWGASTQSEIITNGLCWLKTESVGWILSIAYPLCDDLSEAARDFATLTEYDEEHGIDNTFGFRFFSYESSCVPLFELLRIDEEVPWAKKVNEIALKNAILKFAPSYAQWNNKGDPPFVPDKDEMILCNPNEGINFYQFSLF